MEGFWGTYKNKKYFITGTHAFSFGGRAKCYFIPKTKAKTYPMKEVKNMSIQKALAKKYKSKL